MRYRETRYPCHFATMCMVGGQQRGGTILNLSRNGVMAFLGTGLRVGQKVRITFGGTEREARVVRIDDDLYVGLHLEIPLSRGELQALL